MNVWQQALLSGFLSFLFVTIVTFITLSATPLFGAIIWSLPFGVTATILVFYLAKQPDHKAFKFLISGSCTMVALLAQMAVWGVIIKTKFLNDRLARYWGGFGISLIVWFLVNSIFVGTVYLLPLKQRLSF
jgi:hypothetical protein